MERKEDVGEKRPMHLRYNKREQQPAALINPRLPRVDTFTVFAIAEYRIGIGGVFSKAKEVR